MLRLARFPLLLGLLLVLAQPALATVIHGNFSGTSLDFLQVRETSIFGDPEPLYGAPTVVGNQLTFNPSNYSANSAGGGIDQTGALLQMTIAATGGSSISSLTFSEFGDTTLVGFPGTAATGTFVGIGGVINVTHVNGVALANTIVIPIPVAQLFYTLPGDLGITNWTLASTVDIAAIVPGATQLTVAFNNNLVASSEVGTTSDITKKLSLIPVLVPEPGLVGLLGVAALVGAARSRRS